MTGFEGFYAIVTDMGHGSQAVGHGSQFRWVLGHGSLSLTHCLLCCIPDKRTASNGVTTALIIRLSVHFREYNAHKRFSYFRLSGLDL